MFTQERLTTLLSEKGITLLEFRASSGGSAFVHKAQVSSDSAHIPVGTILALKEFKDPSVDRNRVEQESLVTQTIHNPNLVQGFGCIPIDSPDEIIIALQWIDGTPLKQWVEKNPVNWEQAKQIMLDVLAALEALHNAGIFHRDIKPSNIMITKDRRAIVMDVGIAEMTGESLHTHVTSFIGTMRYASIQFISGDDYTEKDDVYSFGASFFYLVGGQMFLADVPRKALLPQAKFRAITLSAVRDGFPADVRLLIDACLDNNPLYRPTLSQLRDSLENPSDSEFIKEVRERRREAPTFNEARLIARLLADSRAREVKWEPVPSGAPLFREFSQHQLDCKLALRCVVSTAGNPSGKPTKSQIAVARVDIGEWEEERQSYYWWVEHWVYVCEIISGNVIMLLHSIPEGVGRSLFDEARICAYPETIKALMAYSEESGSD